MNLVRIGPLLCVLLNALEIPAKTRPTDTQTKLHLTVKVYNSAHVFPGDLVQAEQRAAAIFHQAKIQIKWDLVPLVGSGDHQNRNEEWNAADVHIRLWTRGMVGSNAFGEDTLGF